MPRNQSEKDPERAKLLAYLEAVKAYQDALPDKPYRLYHARRVAYTALSIESKGTVGHIRGWGTVIEKLHEMLDLPHGT